VIIGGVIDYSTDSIHSAVCRRSVRLVEFESPQLANRPLESGNGPLTSFDGAQVPNWGTDLLLELALLVLSSAITIRV